MGLEPPVDILQIRRTKERVGLCLDQVELHFLVRSFCGPTSRFEKFSSWIQRSKIKLVATALGRLFLHRKIQELFPGRLWSVPSSCGLLYQGLLLLPPRS
jgi:hypothetical protein